MLRFIRDESLRQTQELAVRRGASLSRRMTWYRTVDPRFVPAIKAGTKTSTIRTSQTVYQAGDTLVLKEWAGRPYWSKQRGVGAYRIDSVTPVYVAKDAIYRDTPAGVIAFTPEQMADLVAQDGFPNWSAMLEYFEAHGGVPFFGQLLRWA